MVIRRPAFVGPLVVSVGVLATAVPVAGADVARLQLIEADPPTSSAPRPPDEASRAAPPNTVRVTTVGTDGRPRLLASYPDVGRPDGLLASPDGRWIAVLPDDDGSGGGTAVIVPTAGGAPFALAMPAGVAIARPYSRISWTPDGTELVVGDAGEPTPRPGADPEEANGQIVGWTSLRCPVATRTCVEPPGPTGLAVGVPGGVLVSSSLLSTFPSDYLFAGLDDTPRPEWVRPTSAAGRLLRGLHGDVRTTATHLEGATSRTVGRSEGPASRGVPYTSTMVGGASGALLLRSTLRTRLETRRGRIRLRAGGSGPRLTTVAADGSARTGPVPRVRVARRDLRGVVSQLSPGPQRLSFVPVLGRPDRGWLGFAARDPEPLDDDGEALATLGEDGRAAVVRVVGRAATGPRILGSTPTLGSVEEIIETRLVGYERGSRSALVRFDWRERRPRPSRGTRRLDTTIRVPVDGTGRPSVVPGGADTAW